MFGISLNLGDGKKIAIKSISKSNRENQPIKRNNTAVATIQNEFIPGEIVFTKLKGYSAWPSRIIAQISLQPLKFRVEFFEPGYGDVIPRRQSDVFLSQITKLHVALFSRNAMKKKSSVLQQSIVLAKNEIKTLIE